MRIHLSLILAAGAIVVSGCNLTLAQDIAPPAGYVPPAPIPTLGPLYPSSAPDPESGAAIFAEKCVPCHGEAGLGDGAEGKQLPVTVAALGLPELARQSTPAEWFTMVSQGNLDRFMPPFGSLSTQQRWDVVAYALTLHTNPEVIARGKALFESNCADCSTRLFRDQAAMATQSNADLARIIQQGGDETPAFGAGLSEDDTWAVAAYLRTLTFSSARAEAAATTAAPATEGTAPGSQFAEGTPQASAALEATASAAGVGSVSGRIENRTGSALPAGFAVTLRGYDHESDPSSGPQEVFALEGEVGSDGVFTFEEMELPENRIFVAEATFDGITYRSEFTVVEAAATAVVVPPFAVHATTTDFSALSVDSLQLFFDYANADSVQIFYVYHLRNRGDTAIVVELGGEQELPFISFPAGAQSPGYERGDGAQFVAVEGGLAIPPGEATYGLIAFAGLPKAATLEISQPIVLPIGETRLFLPHGVSATGSGLTDEGLQEIQNTSFNVYATGALRPGDSLAFELSGAPAEVGTAPQLTRNQALILGAGGLGAALILAGLWMYVRERSRANEEQEDEPDDEAPEAIMDAIVALDDLHRAGKLSTEAYQKRRADLKSRLKEGL